MIRRNLPALLGVKDPGDLVLKVRQVPKAPRDQRDPAPPVHRIVHPQEVNVQVRVFTVPMVRNGVVDNVALL